MGEFRRGRGRGWGGGWDLGGGGRGERWLLQIGKGGHGEGGECEKGGMVGLEGREFNGDLGIRTKDCEVRR